MRKELRSLVLGLAGGAGLTIAGFWLLGGSEPESYDDCILKNVKPGLGDHAAALISRSCSEQFPEEPPNPWSKFAGPTMLGDRSLERIAGRAGVQSLGTFGGSLYNGNTSWRVREVAICLRDESGEQRVYSVNVDIPPRTTERFSFRFLQGAFDESPAWSIVSAEGEPTAGPESDDGNVFNTLDLLASCSGNGTVISP